MYRQPLTVLETHEVTNQPPSFEDVDLFSTDRALREAVAFAGGAAHNERLSAFGKRCGSAEVAEWAAQANRNPPQLRPFDRYGQRVDEVDFHPAYHALMQLGLEAGVSSAAWTTPDNGHVLHAALEFLMAQAEPGVCCPMTMTYACLPALEHEPSLFETWAPRVLSSRYDQRSLPASEKRGATIGMAMTEKQGGSDVRANTTHATSNGDGSYTLVGHKWFCSAPMSDAFLTLAYAEGGLTCFLAPRWRPNGERNRIETVRLKDKMGDRANASSEIEYHGAYALRVGEEGRGVRTIIEMVHHTRLDCAIAPAAYMRQAVANALWHTAHRMAFQRRLVDQPLMRSVLSDLVIESEAATALAFRIARSFDESTVAGKVTALSRITTPVGKYWLNKRAPNLVYEAMEAHGGAGYIEESVMPRLFRQSPLNSIWEGSGNVICLDVLRAMAREPETVTTFLAELDKAIGANKALDAAIETLKDQLLKPVEERLSRWIVDRMALALQGTLLAQAAPAFVFDAFCATRLSTERGPSFGAFGTKIDEDALIRRAMPVP